MNARTETTGSVVLDLIKSVVSGSLIVAGIGAYYYYPDTSVLVRAVGVVASLVIAITVFLTTARGRELWRFIQTSRIELRKVVWPTRQETLQTFVAVVVFAMIMGVFFWLLDMLLLWVTRILTGQGG